MRRKTKKKGANPHTDNRWITPTYRKKERAACYVLIRFLFSFLAQRTTRQPCYDSQCVSEAKENTHTNTEYFQVNLSLYNFNIDYVVIIIHFSNSLSHTVYVLQGQHVTCVT